MSSWDDWEDNEPTMDVQASKLLNAKRIRDQMSKAEREQIKGGFTSKYNQALDQGKMKKIKTKKVDSVEYSFQNAYDERRQDSTARPGGSFRAGGDRGRGRGFGRGFGRGYRGGGRGEHRSKGFGKMHHNGNRRSRNQGGDSLSKITA